MGVEDPLFPILSHASRNTSAHDQNFYPTFYGRREKQRKKNALSHVSSLQIQNYSG